MIGQPSTKISRVLIANRGEIAVRVIRACQELGMETVLAASEADRRSYPASLADRVVCVGPPRASSSYLNVPAIITAAIGTRCDAIHPGYGFLAESAELAVGCAVAGLSFVGPRAYHIRSMGDKIAARSLANECGIPTVPGSASLGSVRDAIAATESLGYPVIIKAASGGGGRGMKIVWNPNDLAKMWAEASAEAAATFGDGTLYLERFVRKARHVEVQVMGDGAGNIVHVGERDCSLQRRHQKMIEEAPAYGVGVDIRDRMRVAAIALARRIQYESAGTVEFILDESDNSFYFIEMNTRIQVEHPVTEAITGINLVGEQLNIAQGEPLSIAQEKVSWRGHAIECRVNAESTKEQFRPQTGKVAEWRPPVGSHIRIDTHCHEGYCVPVYYDSLLAKIIVHADTRHEAVTRMQAALSEFCVGGVATTIPFLRFVMRRREVIDGNVTTRLLEELLTEFT